MKFENIKASVKNVAGWLNDMEIEFLYEQAKKVTKNGVIVEIGSYKGKSTICLAGGSEEGNSVKIYAIDPHITDLEQKLYNESESSLETFKKNISDAKLDHLIKPIIGLSQDVVKNWNKPIDFLWIDGDHSYAGAKQDFDLWSPFVVDGGIIAFHDSFYIEVQKVLKEKIFSSDFFSDTGIAGSISYGTKRLKPIPFTEKMRNRSVYMLITGFRIFNVQSLPFCIKVPINRIGKKILKIIK